MKPGQSLLYSTTVLYDTVGHSVYMYDAYMHPRIYVLGLCDNGKSDISISAIIFYRFISIEDIISIMLSAKNLVLSVSSSNLN